MNGPRSAALLSALLTALVLTVGIASADVAPSTGVTPIVCSGNTYSPSLVTVPVGATVEWDCNFDIHPLVSDDNYWTEFSGTAPQAVTFLEDGTFNYHCKIHGGPGTGMHGTVVVGTGVRTPPAGSLPGKPKIEKVSPRTRTVNSLRNAKRFRICIQANEPVRRTVKATAIGKGGRTLFTVTLEDAKLVDTAEDCLMSKKLSSRVLAKLRKFKGKNVSYKLKTTVTDFDGETAVRTTDAVAPKR